MRTLARLDHGVLLPLIAAGLFLAAAGCGDKNGKDPKDPTDETGDGTDPGTTDTGDDDWDDSLLDDGDDGDDLDGGLDDMDDVAPPPPVDDQAKKLSDAYLAEGLTAASSGDVAQAKKSFKSSLDADEGAYQAAYNLGALAEREGKVTLAKKYYKQAIAAKPSYGPAVKAWVFLTARTGSVSDAASFAKSKYDKYPSVPGIAVAHAEMLVLQGKHEKAIDVTKGILKKDETNVEAMLAMARAYISNDQHEFARFILDMAEKNDDANPEIYFLRATVWEATGYPYVARQDLEKAIELKPEFVEARVQLALMLIEGGSFAEAAGHLEAAVALVPDSPAIHLNLGEAYRGMREWEKSHDHLEEAERLGAPKDAVALDMALLYFAADSLPGMDRIKLLENARDRFIEFRNIVGSKAASEVLDIDLTLKQIDKMIKIQKKLAEKKKKAAEAEASGGDGDGSE